MENWAEIRRRVLVDGQSKRSVCREFDIHWDTLQKIPHHSEPPGYRRAAARPKPKLEPFLPVIHQILEADKKAPRKQRHTARRIFERLRDEYGYTGGFGPPRSSFPWPIPRARPRSISVRPRSIWMGSPPRSPSSS
jgi:hypothetical protein